MSKVWRVDVELAATAYIKADSKFQANRKLAQWIANKGWVELRGGIVCTADLDSPGLPEISLAPAMTLKGVYRGEQMELVFEDEAACDD